MVTDYHIQLVQLIIALKLANLNIPDYSCTFDDSYSLFKSDVVDQFIDSFYRISVKGLYTFISCWLILSKEWLLVLAIAASRSTLG